MQLGNHVYVDVNIPSKNEDYWLFFMCYVMTAIGIIWPSQNPIVKAQSNDHARSSGKDHPGERDLEQKNLHWDNGQKKNLMLSYI